MFQTVVRCQKLPELPEAGQVARLVRAALSAQIVKRRIPLLADQSPESISQAWKRAPAPEADAVEGRGHTLGFLPP